MLIEKNIIEEFYCGNLNPSENLITPSPEHVLLNKAAARKEDQLINALGDAEKKLFRQYQNAEDELSCTEYMEHFTAGWLLGARFVLDTFVVPWPGFSED